MRTSEHKARNIRKSILQMVSRAKAAHVGGALSVADLLAVLYFDVLKIDPAQPHWEDRDRLIFSKGHAVAALYATLAERGFVSKETLANYYANGSKLGGHSVRDSVPGIECSTGSLGHGLAMGVGMAIAGRNDGKSHRVFVIVSDGECDEGSTWEAAMFASQMKLDNLVVVVDYNRWQGFGKTDEVVNLEPFREKWQSFGWETREINGHDHGEIFQALSGVPFRRGKPSALIAHTTKGKGVSFMEGRFEWHYLSPNEQQLKNALLELGE
jgi:transketolase